MLNLTRMIRGAMICVGNRYEPPIVLVMLTGVLLLPILKKSTVGTIRRGPNRNAREMRISPIVTVASRSSPRALRNTFWLPRVSATTGATAARDADYTDTYGAP